KSAPPSSSKSIASFIFLFFSVFILVTYIFLLTNIGSTIIYTIFDKDSMWTREYLKTTQLNHFIKMVNQDAEEAREVVYGHIWDYCSYLYVALHNYMLGGDMH
ncbi:MAG: hypothetical protein ACRY3E_05910, partial [Candidatus Lariskella arthropodorum]